MTDPPPSLPQGEPIPPRRSHRGGASHSREKRIVIRRHFYPWRSDAEYLIARYALRYIVHNDIVPFTNDYNLFMGVCEDVRDIYREKPGGLLYPMTAADARRWVEARSSGDVVPAEFPALAEHFRRFLVSIMHDSYGGYPDCRSFFTEENEDPAEDWRCWVSAPYLDAPAAGRNRRGRWSHGLCSRCGKCHNEAYRETREVAIRLGRSHRDPVHLFGEDVGPLTPEQYRLVRTLMERGPLPLRSRVGAASPAGVITCLEDICTDARKMLDRIEARHPLWREVIHRRGRGGRPNYWIGDGTDPPRR